MKVRTLLLLRFIKTLTEESSNTQLNLLALSTDLLMEKVNNNHFLMLPNQPKVLKLNQPPLRELKVLKPKELKVLKLKELKVLKQKELKQNQPLKVKRDLYELLLILYSMIDMH